MPRNIFRSVDKTTKPKSLKALKQEAGELEIPKYSTMKKFELEIAIKRRLDEQAHLDSRTTIDMPVDMLYEISKYLVGTDSFYKMAILSRYINTRLKSLIPKHIECKVLHVFETINAYIKPRHWNYTGVLSKKERKSVFHSTAVQLAFVRRYLNAEVGSMVKCTYSFGSSIFDLLNTTLVKRIDLNYNINWDEEVKNTQHDLVNDRYGFINSVYEKIPFCVKFVWKVLMKVNLMECLTHPAFPFIEFIVNQNYIKRCRTEQNSDFTGTDIPWYTEHYPHLLLLSGILYYLPSNDTIQHLIDLPTRDNWEFFRLYDCPALDKRRRYLNKPPLLW